MKRAPRPATACAPRAGGIAFSPQRGEPRVRATFLETRRIARIVPDGVFDAFSWSTSDELEWRRPAARWDEETPVDGADPARMVFVMRPGAGEFLPRELACLHAFGLGLTTEQALAPWAIDDATDAFHARCARPHEVLWLAADNLNALYWGLHDWAHFHNHGPFSQRAWTELQCDAAALAWLWANRERVPIGERRWEQLLTQVQALSERRFAAEGLAYDGRALRAPRVKRLSGCRGG